MVILLFAFFLFKNVSTSSLCTCFAYSFRYTFVNIQSFISTVKRHPYTHTRLTALFPGPPGWAGTRKVKPIWILLKQDSEWQWHQLGHMQVCISLQTDNHASTPPLKFFTGRMPFLPPNQQCQSTEGTEVVFHGRKCVISNHCRYSAVRHADTECHMALGSPWISPVRVRVHAAESYKRSGDSELAAVSVL